MTERLFLLSCVILLNKRLLSLSFHHSLYLPPLSNTAEIVQKKKKNRLECESTVTRKTCMIDNCHCPPQQALTRD